MLILVFLIGLVTKIGSIQCVNVDLELPSPAGKKPATWDPSCHIQPSYNITTDDNITLIVHKKLYLNFGNYTWLNQTCKLDEKILHNSNDTLSFNIEMNKSSGVMDFSFFHTPNADNFKNVNYKGNQYVQSSCKTYFNVVRAADPAKGNGDYDKWMVIGISVGVVVGLVFIAQTGAIMYFKAKAKAASIDTRMAEGSVKFRSDNDNARYSSTPVANRDHKVPKVPTIGAVAKDEERESQMYESINNSPHLVSPIPPPISSLPKSRRVRHPLIDNPEMELRLLEEHPSPIVRIREMEKLGMLATPHKDNRPRLPTPSEEIYEELPHTHAVQALPLPPRTPPVKKLPPPKPRIVRPGLTLNPVITSRTVPRRPKATEPKPPLSPIDKSMNELNQILQKRRHNLQDTKKPAFDEIPLSPKTLPRKPKPPAVFVKPKREPPSNPEPLEKSDDESYHGAQSEDDENEWTYEPLKPLDEVMNRKN